MSVDFNKPLCRLLVVSDLHAFASKDKDADSVLDLTDAGSVPSNPLDDLISLAQSHSFDVNVLICGGDICNRADAGGLTRAWGRLQVLQGVLGASDLIATCGNHDLDSRYLGSQSDPDAKGALQSLDPGFPFSDEARANKFWARNYVVTSIADTTIVNVNTSAYHGGDAAEIDYGRVSLRTVEAITREVKALPAAKAYVLLCHHHPMPLSAWGGKDDTEFLKNGQNLLDALVGVTGTTWLVVHGHRHKPRLMQAASSTSAAPFVLGSGSLGARMPGIPNQFHIVSLYECTLADHSGLVGTVRTWSWTDSSKWQAALHPEGLPAHCGFGYRGQIGALVNSIVLLVGNAFKPWSVIRSTCPAVDLLLPQDMKELERLLLLQGVSVLRSSDGLPMQVGV